MLGDAKPTANVGQREPSEGRSPDLASLMQMTIILGPSAAFPLGCENRPVFS